jgi:hypothetical protein
MATRITAQSLISQKHIVLQYFVSIPRRPARLFEVLTIYTADFQNENEYDWIVQTYDSNYTSTAPIYYMVVYDFWLGGFCED